MKLTLSEDDIGRISTGLLGVACFEEAPEENALVTTLDAHFGGALIPLLKREQFKAKPGQTFATHGFGHIAAARLLLVGLGPRQRQRPSEDPIDWRGFAATVMRAAAAFEHATLAVPATAAPGPLAQALTEGALLGAYRFDKYLTGERKRPWALAEVALVLAGERGPGEREAGARETGERGIGRGVAVARAVARARDLVNEPAGELTPMRLADAARRVAEDTRLDIAVLGPAECKALGMGLYLAVAQGSDEEPRLVHLSCRPRGTPLKKIALIGKGVTFDSGGLSMKTSAGMEHMKTDMAGAAAVLSAIGALAALDSPYEVHAICACTENMVSGRSYKLGDVLRSMSGKTVEINNTDAEGRLTLADAITYALDRIAPDEVLDFATLTGACVVGLGPHTAGVMGNDRALVQRWLDAAGRAGEDMWHLPLSGKLRDQLKSDIADLRNNGEPFGGALTAGLFIQEFVGTTPWLHVDFAGPSLAMKESGHIAKGGTGFAVATLLEYLAPAA